MNPRFGYLTVFVTMLVALVLACCSSGGAHGACSAFLWCLAGLGTALGLDCAMDAAGRRSHVWKT
jgi:hypothetical protein